MYLLNGFIPHASLVVNTPGVNNPIGELSTESLTFSREKGVYKSNTNTGIVLISFKSEQDGVEVAVPLDMYEQAIAVSKSVYDRTFAAPGTPQSLDTILSDLTAQFSGQANTFQGGPIRNDGRFYMPEWLSWKSNLLADAEIKIWYVDAAFKSQYPFDTIVVVPPFDNIDQFFLAGQQVETILNNITAADSTNRLQAAKGGHPETVVRAEMFNYYDPLNVARVIPTTWGVLIYGEAGNNIDKIKEALINYILTHSTHTRNEWAQILPDLFLRTEFICIPLWNQYAIENRVTTAGIYSPIAYIPQTLALMKAKLPTYAPTHIDQFASLQGFPYKSLAIAIIGNVENRGSKYKLIDHFPDYIAVSSTSQDFNRMQVRTREWALMMARLVEAAEEITDFTAPPEGITKMTRDGILYVVQSYESVQYLVASRASIDV